MRKIMIACAVVTMMLTQAAAQNNNQTVISDVPKQRGGDQGLGTGTWLSNDGMNDTQAGTDNIDEIGFADDVPGSPIDGGLSVLLAAGVVAGANRIRREVNKSKEKDNSSAK
jgi:hypothetical protein